MPITITEPAKRVRVALRTIGQGAVVDDTDFREESRSPQYETIVDIKREVLDTHGEPCTMQAVHLTMALELITGMTWTSALILAQGLWPLLERGERVVLCSHKRIQGPLSTLCNLIP